MAGTAEICCHGHERSSVILRVSGDVGMPTIWQGGQALQNFSASFSHPGHQILVRSLRFIDTIPGWPSRARRNTLFRKPVRTTI